MVDPAARSITIAGAGVAGLTCAITLARAGYQVRVLERGPAPGSHRGPEWDAVENWTSTLPPARWFEQVGIDGTRFLVRETSRFAVIDPRGHVNPVSSPRPFVALVRRGPEPGGLEHGLARQAADLGVSIEVGAVCARDEADVWAVGTHAVPPEFLSTGVRFRTDLGDLVCGLVDPRIAPRAYAYFVVVDGEATLGVVLTERFRDARRLLDRAIAAYQRHYAFSVARPVHWGGQGGDRRSFAEGRRGLVIGEAGGYADFLWGFGIRLAILSGHLAGRSIAEGTDWQAIAERELRPIVRASLANRWFYDRLPSIGHVALVRAFTRSRDVSERVSRWYRPRRLHALARVKLPGDAQPQATGA